MDEKKREETLLEIVFNVFNKNVCKGKDDRLMAVLFFIGQIILTLTKIHIEREMFFNAYFNLGLTIKELKVGGTLEDILTESQFEEATLFMEEHEKTSQNEVGKGITYYLEDAYKHIDNKEYYTYSLAAIMSVLQKIDMPTFAELLKGLGILFNNIDKEYVEEIIEFHKEGKFNEAREIVFKSMSSLVSSDLLKELMEELKNKC